VASHLRSDGSHTPQSLSIQFKLVHLLVQHNNLMRFQKCAILAYMTYNKSLRSLLLYGHLISLTTLR